MASGVTVGALGFGTAIIAPAAQWLIQQPGLGVLGMFRVLGVAFFVVLALASLVLVNPPAGCARDKASEDSGLGWSEMLAQPRFWLLYVLYVFGAFSGLMIISQAAPIAQEMARVNKGVAAGIVAVLGLANATGRVVWGSVSDKIGRLPSLALMFLVTMVTMFLLPGLAVHKGTLVPAVILVGACFGGYLGTFPSLCADTFGARNAAVNYALLFSAFSVAAVAGPKIGAKLGQTPGGYADAFVTAGVVAALGLALAVAMRIADARVHRHRAV
jgi:OFA family oxalate/formate antiporter-like MFS transporter